MNLSKIPLWMKIVGSFCKRVLNVTVNGLDKARVYEGHPFNASFNESASIILSKEQLENQSLMKKYKYDALRCYIRWGFTPRDFFLFGFHDENNTTKLRKTFVSDCYKDYKLFSKEGSEKYAELFDKSLFLNKVGDEFLGNMGGHILINKQVSCQQFVDFALRYSDLFIKPNSSSYGNGAMTAIIKTADEAKALFAKLKEENTDWVVEKRIIQSESLAKWNVSSVNTVRLNTFLTNRGFFVLAPFLRTGRKGSIVDNGGKGGVYALLDEKCGQILTNGRDEKGGFYIKHPDSGVTFKGEVLPDWNGLLKTAEKIHREKMADHIYISWDFAHTTDGWRLIEGNWGQFICQQSSSHRGFKKSFDEYLKGHAIIK